MGHRTGLVRCGKYCPHRDSFPVPSILQRVAIPTELFRPVTLRVHNRTPSLLLTLADSIPYEHQLIKLTPFFLTPKSSVQSSGGRCGIYKRYIVTGTDLSSITHRFPVSDRSTIVPHSSIPSILFHSSV